nr:hypothetical protein [uncultured Dyadobacter sp.]
MQDRDKTEGLKQLKNGFGNIHVLKGGGRHLSRTYYDKKPFEALQHLISLSESYPNSPYIEGKLAEVLLSAGKPGNDLVHIQNLMDSDITGYRNLALVKIANNISNLTNEH